MLRRAACTLLTFSLLMASGCSNRPPVPPGADEESSQKATPLQRFGRSVLNDYREAYSNNGLLEIGKHIAIHGLLANSHADRAIRDQWQQDWRNESTDDFFHPFIRTGDLAQNRWSLPLYSLGMIAGGYSGLESDSPLATWASRSLRANLLAGPQGWALTYALGTHRPTAGHSGWNPWNDNDGVSGHSLYGAIPFLTAARMSESPWLKATLIGASTLPALARINLNKHYTSQAYLGWALAWTATDVIARDAADDGQASWLLLPLPNGAFASVRIRF